MVKVLARLPGSGSLPSSRMFFRVGERGTHTQKNNAREVWCERVGAWNARLRYIVCLYTILGLVHMRYICQKVYSMSI